MSAVRAVVFDKGTDPDTLPDAWEVAMRAKGYEPTGEPVTVQRNTTTGEYLVEGPTHA